MQYVCDAPGDKAWFRIESLAEAEAESQAMGHAVAAYFERELGAARASYQQGEGLERDIGLKSHIARTMPMFLTLRADDGEPLATAMLPPTTPRGGAFRVIIVGPRNSDPYTAHGDSIAALGRHVGLNLAREKCYPYG